MERCSPLLTPLNNDKDVCPVHRHEIVIFNYLYVHSVYIQSGLMAIYYIMQRFNIWEQRSDCISVWSPPCSYGGCLIVCNSMRVHSWTS